MPNDALARLISKTRPFKTFTVEMPDGSSETFQVRRTNVADNERIMKAYTEAYDGKIRTLQDDETADFSVLRRSLLRQRAEDLAKYIAAATRPDIESDVLDLFDGEDVTAESPKVKKKVDAELAKLEETLRAESLDILIEKALEKREHFAALFQANAVRMRNIAACTIFTLEGEPLFPDVESVAGLDEATLERLISAATAALTEEDKDSRPLK